MKMSEMWEGRITHFPPEPSITPENPAIWGAPTPAAATVPVVAVLELGGHVTLGPAGSLGPVTPQQVALGVDIIEKYLQPILAEYHVQAVKRRAAPHN